MNIIPALEMKGWRASASDCTGNQIVVKYEFVSSETFKCRVCKDHRNGPLNSFQDSGHVVILLEETLNRALVLRDSVLDKKGRSIYCVSRAFEEVS